VTAPAIMTNPVKETPAPTAAPAAPAPNRCDFAVTLENDQTFEFGKTVLRIAAKKRIDTEILSKLSACGRIDIILVTGHADRLGSQQYNQKLSKRRAEALATYLTSKGVLAQMDTLGMGKTQAIKECDDKLGRQKLIKCLAPNRRVVVEVRGLSKIN
jgi:OOP family OmpA-OmpF porin